jgi:hypothetical protein
MHKPTKEKYFAINLGKLLLTNKFSLMLTLFLLLSGCSTFNGVPQSPLEFSDPPKEIKSEEDLINRYSSDLAHEISKGEVINPIKRNELISKALTIIDVRYSEFINKTELDRKNKEMLADIVELSMNLAGTAVGSAGTKTILAAISAGVNGINAGVDKNYFYEKTFPSLVAQMNADRKDALIVLTKGMASKNIGEYPWSQAVHDLINYYNAGTLLGAIMSIQKEAGEKESHAEFIIKGLRQINFQETQTGVWLTDFLEPDGIRNKERESLIINSCIKQTRLWEENKSTSVIAEFLIGSEWENERIECKNKKLQEN